MKQLPKQFAQWVKSAGLKFEFNGKEEYHKYNLIGYNRYFRVTEQYELEISKEVSEFKNWYISFVDTSPIPETEQEFVDIVNKLVHNATHENEIYG